MCLTRATDELEHEHSCGRDLHMPRPLAPRALQLVRISLIRQVSVLSFSDGGLILQDKHSRTCFTLTSAPSCPVSAGDRPYLLTGLFIPLSRSGHLGNKKTLRSSFILPSLLFTFPLPFRPIPSSRYPSLPVHIAGNERKDWALARSPFLPKHHPRTAVAQSLI